MPRVLVIDDETMICDLLKKILEHGGHEPCCVERAAIGMRKFREEPFDLVITDIFLPDMDGLEVVKELHADFPDTPIIVMSGGSDVVREDFLPIAQQMGASGAIPKPFDVENLLSTVSEVLEQKTPRTLSA